MIITCSIGLATHLYRPGTTLDGGIGARCRLIFVYVRSNFIVNQGEDGLQTSTSMKTSTTRHEGDFVDLWVKDTLSWWNA